MHRIDEAFRVTLPEVANNCGRILTVANLRSVMNPVQVTYILKKIKANHIQKSYEMLKFIDLHQPVVFALKK